MSRYAEGTTVSIDQSINEIKRTLQRFGADSFTYREDGEGVAIAFEVRALHVMMRVMFPDLASFTATETGRPRSDAVARDEWGKECRRKMRCLAAVIKAKLIAVDDAVATIEQEFLPYIVLPDGRNIGDVLIPRLPAIISGQYALPAARSEE